MGKTHRRRRRWRRRCGSVADELRSARASAGVSWPLDRHDAPVAAAGPREGSDGRACSARRAAVLLRARSIIYSRREGLRGTPVAALPINAAANAGLLSRTLPPSWATGGYAAPPLRSPRRRLRYAPAINSLHLADNAKRVTRILGPAANAAPSVVNTSGRRFVVTAGERPRIDAPRDFRPHWQALALSLLVADEQAVCVQ